MLNELKSMYNSFLGMNATDKLIFIVCILVVFYIAYLIIGMINPMKAKMLKFKQGQSKKLKDYYVVVGDQTGVDTKKEAESGDVTYIQPTNIDQYPSGGVYDVTTDATTGSDNTTPTPNPSPTLLY
jgi:hypothetical protein